MPTLEIAERRVLDVPVKFEIRDSQDGGMTITGHAAVFDQLSDELGFFREKIARGAFRKVLDSQPDVRLLINHDENLVLARTKNGTLSLVEDPTGLLVEGQVADTSYAKDLRVLMQRGDIDQMSFMFSVGIDEWDETVDPPIRTVKEYKELFDASIVTFPAYPQTDAQMRGRKEKVEFRTKAEREAEEQAETRSSELERLRAVTSSRVKLAAAGVTVERDALSTHEEPEPEASQEETDAGGEQSDEETD